MAKPPRFEVSELSVGMNPQSSPCPFARQLLLARNLYSMPVSWWEIHVIHCPEKQRGLTLTEDLLCAKPLVSLADERDGEAHFTHEKTEVVDPYKIQTHPLNSILSMMSYLSGMTHGSCCLSEGLSLNAKRSTLPSWHS